MDYGNVNWIVAIVSLLVGLGVGAASYRHFATSANQLQNLRRQLAERERELGEMRKGMNEHFSQVGMMVGNLQREMRTLEHRLTEDASTLHCEPPGGARLDAADRPALTDQEDDLPAPRDYADGTGGTLSEDFGLKPSGSRAEEPQPPRY
ncbi:Z-ring associated ZapG family protein [Billgrantia pellis]|uniref:YhcB family protein n=1 Tax=Billgrantia pellis TaxID=2606936 RepID=UPI001659B291|nr:DUF1043 family protein [Halomonas pellis]